MSVDVFSGVFAKFYYLHRKYGENFTIDKYNNIRTNPLYQDYFKKLTNANSLVQNQLETMLYEESEHMNDLNTR